MNHITSSPIILRSITGVLYLAILFFAYIASQTAFSFVIMILFVQALREWCALVPKTSLRFWVFTPIYLIIPFCILLYLNYSDDRFLIVLIFLMASIHDTAAYLCGILLGTHKIIPSISPAKTWSGFLGGILATTTLGLYIAPYPTITASLIFGIACGLFAFLGDLVESWCKRKAHHKESGVLLPGHGGILDRCDSMLLLTIFIFIISIGKFAG